MSEITLSMETYQALITRIERLEHAVLSTTRLGPQEPTALELGAAARQVEKFVEAAREKWVKTDAPPVDRSARVLVSGDPVPEDYSHTELKENGQQRDYVVLTPSERTKGYVRRYRDAYRHLKFVWYEMDGSTGPKVGT
jgi:hypothetical protein